MCVFCQHTHYKRYMMTMAEPKREHDRVFQMRVSDSFVDAVDGWRRVQQDLPSRAEAVRRLIQRSLGATASAKLDSKEKDPSADIWETRR